MDLSGSATDLTFSSLTTGVTAWGTASPGTIVQQATAAVGANACTNIENTANFSALKLYALTKPLVNCVISLKTTPAQSPVTTHFE
jgi:hypothetical protein